PLRARVHSRRGRRPPHPARLPGRGLSQTRDRQPDVTISRASMSTREMELASPAYKWTLGLSLAALQSAMYFGIGHAHLARSTELLRTRLDDMIPLLPWTVWCYLPFYAAIFVMAIAGFRRRALFNGAVMAVVVVMLIGAAGHLFIGAEYPRPR